MLQLLHVEHMLVRTDELLTQPLHELPATGGGFFRPHPIYFTHHPLVFSIQIICYLFMVVYLRLGARSRFNAFL